MKFLLLSVLCFLACCPFLAESMKNHSASSTTNPGFFGYFGNFWKKQVPSSSPPAYSTSEQSAGLFDHVKKWVNVIKDKIPLQMQATGSTMNSTKISATSRIKRIRFTARVKNRTAVSLSISNTSETKNIKRRADTEILGITKSSSEFPTSSDAISPETNNYLSSYEFVVGRSQEIVSSMNMNIFSSALSTSVISISSLAELNLSMPAVGPKMKINPFVYLEKINNGADLSYECNNRNNHTATQSTLGKLFKGNKLTPAYISFYNADDLGGNGSKREVPTPLTTFSSLNTRSRTRKSRSRSSKKVKTTKSRSISENITIPTDSGADSVLD